MQIVMYAHGPMHVIQPSWACSECMGGGTSIREE